MSSLTSNKTEKIELGEDEWVEVKSSIPFAEIKPLLKDIDQDDPMQNIEIAIPLLKKAIVDWNLQNEEGEEEEFEQEKIERLNTEATLTLLQKAAPKYFPDKKKEELLGK